MAKNNDIWNIKTTAWKQAVVLNVVLETITTVTLEYLDCVNKTFISFVN